ncbi:TonB-dependent receptor [Herbaspirillum sp. HC18]|nr:TonB-dependent receptor [Herbaspirillum sp. HC18]
MRPSNCVMLALASILAWQASDARAQSAEEDELALVYGDKSTVSIATGTQQPLRRAPAVATVITAADIAAMGATDLDEVLETVPGVHVSRNPIIYTPVYVIRGIGASGPTNPQVLLMQNGIPLTSMYTGDKGNMWSGMPVENIARIEIIRGPGSALYGADAYSGVINIITKTASDIQGTRFGVRAGSFDTGDAWLQHGGKLGEVDIAAYLRVGSTNGFKEIISADAQTRNDRIFGTRASLAPGPVNTGRDAVDGGLDFGYGKWRLRTNYVLRDNIGTGAGVSSALDPVGYAKSERIGGDLSWTDPQFAQEWGAGFLASYQQYTELTPNRLILLPPGLVLPTGAFPDGMIGGPNRWERQVRLSAYATYSGIADHQLRFGLGHDDLDLYKTSTYKNFLLNPAGVPIPTGPVIEYSAIQPHILPQRRKVDYLYVQDEWKFARDWTLTAGVRHDRYSDFGGTTNPRLALVWDAALDVTTKLLYGRAFRAPSFNEQYGINPVANGNPKLQPELINTIEWAIAWQAKRDLQFNLNLFRYEMSDIIRAVPNPVAGTGATYNNVGRQHGNGMEVEIMWDASRNLRISGNYAYQRSIDEATNQDAGYAPHHQVYARADWHFASGWIFSPQLNWVADRKRPAGDPRPPVPDYTSVDLTLRTNHGKDQWDFAATVRNLFNADIREPSLAPGTAIPNDLPMAGRAFYLQAVYKM